MKQADGDDMSGPEEMDDLICLMRPRLTETAREIGLLILFSPLSFSGETREHNALVKAYAGYIVPKVSPCRDALEQEGFFSYMTRPDSSGTYPRLFFLPA